MPYRCAYSIQSQVIFETDLTAALIDDAMLESSRIARQFVGAWNETHPHREKIEEHNVTRTLINVGPQLPVWELTQILTCRVAAETIEEAVKHAPKDRGRWQVGALSVNPATTS